MIISSKIYIRLILIYKDFRVWLYNVYPIKISHKLIILDKKSQTNKISDNNRLYLANQKHK